MKKLTKRVFVILMSLAVMMIGSSNVIFAQDIIKYPEVPSIARNTVVIFEAICDDLHGEASTWIYLDRNVEYAVAEVSMRLYTFNSAGDPTEYDSGQYDRNVLYYGENTLVTADVYCSTYGHHGAKVESDHYAELHIRKGFPTEYIRDSLEALSN